VIETGSQPDRRWRLGVVSYLNAKPLVAGLDNDEDIELIFDVPARLPALLDSGFVDVALVPVTDLVEPGRTWRIISDACIGCDGETLTVRVFSRVPPERIRTLHVDGDSHTSVVLARIIWAQTYGYTLDIRPYDGTETLAECEAVLLIGDKVVDNRLIDYDIETDLGAAWKSLMSLPFVFAVWAGPCGSQTDRLAERLGRARDRGVELAALIAEDFGPGLHWPVELAKRYLTSRIKYTLGPRQQQAIVRFLELARQYGLLEAGRELIFG
jgi:chorismate dehydratase